MLIQIEFGKIQLICHLINFYYTMCHNLNNPNIKIKCLRLFQNNTKIFLIIKNWDTWQHITCSHCSLKKLHPSDKLKDESIFH
jgi:hypothetical protein